MPLPRITYKRYLVQVALITAQLLLPFVTVAGNPFLRMDIALRTFFLAGVPIRVDQFYLILLATLLMVMLFLLVTVTLGRVWCGWLCPQTVFNDLAELVGRFFHRRLPDPAALVMEHLTALIIAKLIAFNLFCWFMPPGRAYADLLNVRDHPLMLTCFLLLTLFGYLNLILVKRSFCRSYCPYGRIQSALLDQGTLTLAFLNETSSLCLKCGACVKVCPMDIDIRAGFQIECIGCGRCIDACRSVMERQPHGEGLIDYRFGDCQGTQLRFGPKTIVLTLLTLLLAAALVWGVFARTQAGFALQRIATAETRDMPDGYQLQAWRAILANRSQMAVSYAIRVAPSTADDVSLVGQVSGIPVAANEHREITFFLRRKPAGNRSKTVELQLLNGPAVVATVTLTQ